MKRLNADAVQFGDVTVFLMPAEYSFGAENLIFDFDGDEIPKTLVLTRSKGAMVHLQIEGNLDVILVEKEWKRVRDIYFRPGLKTKVSLSVAEGSLLMISNQTPDSKLRVFRRHVNKGSPK